MIHHREHDIRDPEGFSRLVDSLRSEPALAVDLETNSMHAYRSRLCFVQLATAESIFIVDTLGLDATPLNDPFQSSETRKVFHDAQGDLRVLASSGIHVRNLFDTQRAAMLLGLPKIGLGDLVEERFGIKLKKEHQTADFGQRPLPEELRAYVADDVRYLLPLARELEEEAREKDIAEELALEFERLAEENDEPETPPRPKLPGPARDVLGLAIAEAADRLRHREAKGRDLPVGRVLANAAIGEIALRRPVSMRDLARIPGVKASFLRPAGDELLAEIVRLKALDEEGALPKPEAPAARRDPHRRGREEKLKAWRSEAAKARGVVPSVVLPNSLVEALASTPPRALDDLANLRWFGEKRTRLYGGEILKILASS